MGQPRITKLVELERTNKGGRAGSITHPIDEADRMGHPVASYLFDYAWVQVRRRGEVYIPPFAIGPRRMGHPVIWGW